MSDFLSEFRNRMEAIQSQHGLADTAFAKKIGLPYMTYRNLMGRDKKRKGSQGPTLETILTISNNLDIDDFYFLVTGRTTDGKLSVGPGPEVSQYLDMARKVLESGSEREAKHLQLTLELCYEKITSLPKEEPPVNPRETNPTARRGRKAVGGV